MTASFLPRFVACLTCALLLLPPAGAVRGSADCGGITAMTIEDETLPADVHLRLTFARDGITRIDGFIRQRGPTSPTLEPRGEARTACADIDADGTPGLVRVSAQFQDSESGERVRVVLAPIKHDLDASGVYRATIDVAASGMIGDIRTVISAEAA